jgi:hypothetical protein
VTRSGCCIFALWCAHVVLQTCKPRQPSAGADAATSKFMMMGLGYVKLVQISSQFVTSCACVDGFWPHLTLCIRCVLLGFRVTGAHHSVSVCTLVLERCIALCVAVGFEVLN